jgi:hypothetical protein
VDVGDWVEDLPRGSRNPYGVIDYMTWAIRDVTKRIDTIIVPPLSRCRSLPLTRRAG